MNKKPNYAEMFTLRKDGRYQGYYRELDKNGERKGRRHIICDRDPEKLYRKLMATRRLVPSNRHLILPRRQSVRFMPAFR